MSTKKLGSEQSSSFDFSSFEGQLLEHVRNHGGSAAIGGEAFVKELMSRTYQALLDAELEEHLGYTKHDPEGHGIGNSRNGRGKKKIKGDFGEVVIEPPRDRAGTFDPEIVKKRSSIIGNFTDKIISLHARGMATRDIAAHLHEMYGIELSESFVSRAVSSSGGSKTFLSPASMA